MGVVDQLVSTVQASQKMDQGKKEVVVAFLQAAGPTHLFNSIGEMMQRLTMTK